MFYEGHSELQSALTPHRFHCHRCGKLYIVRSTSHKPPRFRINARHEVMEPTLGGGLEHLEAPAADDDGLADEEPLLGADDLPSIAAPPDAPSPGEDSPSTDPTSS